MMVVVMVIMMPMMVDMLLDLMRERILHGKESGLFHQLVARNGIQEFCHESYLYTKISFFNIFFLENWVGTR